MGGEGGKVAKEERGESGVVTEEGDWSRVLIGFVESAILGVSIDRSERDLL